MWRIGAALPDWLPLGKLKPKECVDGRHVKETQQVQRY